MLQILYWFLLLSTNIKVADTIFDIYLKVQSFQSNRSLISGVLLTTGTIQYHKRSKTQKAKVKESKSESGHIHPKVKVATFTKKHMKDLLLKNLTGSSSSHPPLRPLLFSSLAPSASLLRPERPPHSALLSSCCSGADPWGRGHRLSSQRVNIGLREQGSSSKITLVKKMLLNKHQRSSHQRSSSSFAWLRCSPRRPSDTAVRWWQRWRHWCYGNWTSRPIKRGISCCCSWRRSWEGH